MTPHQGWVKVRRLLTSITKHAQLTSIEISYVNTGTSVADSDPYHFPGSGFV